MVIATAGLELLVGRIDAGANGGRFPEIERRAFNGPQLARGDQAAVDRREPVGIDGDQMVENGAAAAQVEIGVVREVDHRGLVGVRGEIDPERVVVGQGVDGRHGQISGITLLAVLAEVGEFKGGAELALNGTRLPDDFVEPFESAVQRVGAVVGGERVGFALKGEPALGDAIAVPADQGAEIGGGLGIGGDAVAAFDDIDHLAVAVRHDERNDDAAVVGDRGFRARGVAQRVALHILAVNGAEWFLGDSRSSG